MASYKFVLLLTMLNIYSLNNNIATISYAADSVSDYLTDEKVLVVILL
jgi:hypothetical protein